MKKIAFLRETLQFVDMNGEEYVYRRDCIANVGDLEDFRLIYDENQGNGVSLIGWFVDWLIQFDDETTRQISKYPNILCVQLQSTYKSHSMQCTANSKCN